MYVLRNSPLGPTGFVHAKTGKRLRKATRRINFFLRRLFFENHFFLLLTSGHCSVASTSRDPAEAMTVVSYVRFRDANLAEAFLHVWMKSEEKNRTRVRPFYSSGRREKICGLYLIPFRFDRRVTLSKALQKPKPRSAK